MDRRPLKTRSKPWAPALALTLVRFRLTPNQVSLLGIGISGVGCWMLIAHPQRWSGLLVAALCIQVRLLCNMLDGLMAVEGEARAKDGIFFNEVPDRVEDALLLVGAGFGAGIPHIGWLAAVLAVTTAYLRAFGAALGMPQDYCGPGAKPQRMFVLTLGCLAGAVWLFVNGAQQAVAWSVWVVAVLTGATVIRRGWRLRRNLLMS